MEQKIKEHEDKREKVIGSKTAAQENIKIKRDMLMQQRKEEADRLRLESLKIKKKLDKQDAKYLRKA